MTPQIARPRLHIPGGEEFLLLSPTEQAFAYRNIDRMFATRTIQRGAVAAPWDRGTEIAPIYAVQGEMRTLDDYIARTKVAGLLVIDRGTIVLERYGLGLTEDTGWSSMSMVKSMTSTLVGAAIEDGAIRSLDDSVPTYLPALRGSAYDGVTIRHIITMSSGVRWSEVYTDRHSDVNRYSKSLGDKVPGGVLAIMRDLPAEAPPGTRFNYNTGDTYVLGCLLSAATGKTLAAYMSEKIWRPCGMEFDARYTLESDDGQEIGGSRASMALRDFGRFGMLLLGDGVVGGRRLLPPDWLDQAGSIQFPLDPAQNSYKAVGYGYSWWIGRRGEMAAVGFAGQSICADRRLGVVIVTLSCWPQPPFAAAYDVDYAAERQAFNGAVVDLLRGGA